MIAPGVDPEFLIQDGAHRGNAHFFFLPPLVPPARYSGVPDGTLQPEVTVCPLIGGSCGASIARFTTAPAANTLQQIRYDRFTGSYYLVWDTRKCLAGPCALDAAKRYRLKVSIGDAELGWVDLDVVAKIRELTGVSWGTDAGVVRDLPLPVAFRVEQGAIALISIHEVIAVRDAPSAAKSKPPMPDPINIAVNETVRVADVPSALPPITVGVAEVVVVTDGPQVLGALSINIRETIGVTDAANVTLQ